MKDVYEENDVYSPETAAVIIDESVATLEEWRRMGCGPPWVRLGHSPHSPVGYPPTVLEYWANKYLTDPPEIWSRE